MGTDLVRATPIMRHVQNGEITPELNPETILEEKARWASGGTEADQRVVTALTAIEEGRALIDLNVVLNKGGTSQNTGYDSKLPALAVAPAFAKEVSIRVWHDGEMRLRAKTRVGRRGWQLTRQGSAVWARSTAISYSAVATVPTMPPEVRSVAKKDHLVLWEATWRKLGTQEQRPPIDPALLEHVSGDLYVVLAAWELSPLEVAALGG